MNQQFQTGQRSPEWYAARRGKVTASCAKILLTEPRSKADKEAGNLAETTKTYLMKLIGERFTGQDEPEFSTKATDWGHEHEPYAAARFEYETGIKLSLCDFVSHDDWSGASPDRFTDDGGLVEIKCPYLTKNYLDLVITPIKEIEYYPQIQFQLMITGKSHAYFVSYDPRMPSGMDLHWQLVERDEELIAELEKRLSRATIWIFEQYNLIINKFAKDEN